MALFARIPKQKAQELLERSWPMHYWTKVSLWNLLNTPVNRKAIPNIPLNDQLLESVRKHGFVSPFLVIDTWYPICGGQRLRVAMELDEKYLRKTLVDVCRISQPVWMPFHSWHSAEEGQKACQIFFQMFEVVFKTLYMDTHDPDGVQLLHYEEYGNQLHWPQRDAAQAKMIQKQVSNGPPSKKKMVIPNVTINNT
jgi:hypothetical protein